MSLLILLLLLSSCAGQAKYRKPSCPPVEECSFKEFPTQEEYIQQQVCIQKLVRSKNICLDLWDYAWDKSSK